MLSHFICGFRNTQVKPSCVKKTKNMHDVDNSVACHLKTKKGDWQTFAAPFPESVHISHYRYINAFQIQTPLTDRLDRAGSLRWQHIIKHKSWRRSFKETRQNCISVSHLRLNAGFVCFGDREKDLLCQQLAVLYNLLKFRTFNKCASFRQRCAEGERGHVARNGENCKKEKQTKQKLKKNKTPKSSRHQRRSIETTPVIHPVCCVEAEENKRQNKASSQPVLSAAYLGMSPLGAKYVQQLRTARVMWSLSQK